MSTDIGFLLVHSALIEPWLGVDSNGAQLYGPAVSERCFRVSKRRLVRSPTTGDQIVSESSLICATSAVAPVGSRVTDPLDGRTATVITSNVNTMPGYPTPDHIELFLT